MTSKWQPARIIPVSGINSAIEAEQRATSALLAVLGIVRPFSKALLSQYGASNADRARVESFLEVSFKDSSGKTVRPDGLIRVTHGKRAPWTALVEVKTGSSCLGAEQVNAYWDVARAEGFDAVITVSNEISPSPGVHPTDGLRSRANSKVQIHHLSWTRLLVTAVKEKTHRGIEDPEQDWILGELIRYLEHDSSGAMAFDDMGPQWNCVRDEARHGTLNARSNEAIETAQRWDQLLGFVSLRLGADIGEDVTEIIPRAQQLDPKLRTRIFVDQLCNEGALRGSLRIPNTIGDLDIQVDLKARQVAVSVAFDAPSDKKAKGQIGWLLRQLRDCPGRLVIEAYPKNSRNGIASRLEGAREDNQLLVAPSGKPASRFRLIARSEMGLTRKSGKRPGFVQSVTDAVESFYGEILQNLTAYQARAPQLKQTAVESADAVVLPSVELIETVPTAPELPASQDDAPADSGGTADSWSTSL